MATKITVSEDDIVVTEQRAEFGLHSCRSTGRIVKVLDTYTLAQFRRGDGTAEYREICDTCYGTGFRPEYAGVFGGTCFPCNGSGLHRKVGQGTPVEMIRVLRRREADRIRRQAKRQEAEQAKQDAHARWLADNPELAARLAEVRATLDAEGADARAFNPTTRDLAVQGGHRPLSAAQIDLFDKLYQADRHELAERQRKAAARGWIGQKNDKVTFTGTLVFTRHFTSEVGYRRTATSTLYTLQGADGTTVKWFRSGCYTPALGETYTVKGTVKKLEDSPQYGKATVITRGEIVAMAAPEPVAA